MRKYKNISPMITQKSEKLTQTDVGYLKQAVEYVKDCDKTKRRAKDRVNITFIFSMVITIAMIFIFILFRNDIFDEVDLWVEIITYILIFTIFPFIIPFVVRSRYEPEMYQKCIATTPNGDYVEL